VTAETYILNYSGNCYGKEIKVKVVKFLRDEKKFGSLEELKKAVGENVDYVKTNSKANK
jgi:riboflavin kinase/FMN adenylyltransferase